MKRFPATPSTTHSINVMRLGFVGVICAVMLHTTGEVHAQEKSWRLEYRRGPEAPSNCPDESYLRTALAAKYGSREPFANDAPRTITIELIPTPERIEARIHARNEQGNVVSESIAHAPAWRCDQLADRIVFVLRDIIDPVALPEPTSPDNQSNTAHPSSLPEELPKKKKPVVLDQPQPNPKPSPKKSESSNPRLSLSLSLGASWWNAPRTAFTSVLGIGGRWSKFSIGIEGRYDRAWALPLRESVLAEQLALGIVACGYHAFRPSRLYIRGCLVGDWARLSTETNRVRLNEATSTAVHVGARAGAGLTVTDAWSVELYADGIIAVQQPRFVFNAQEDWRLPRFNGAVRASVVRLFDVF